MPILRNTERADRVINFINLLPIVDGNAVGQRFTVDPWQEEWLRAIYEPEYDAPDTQEHGKPVVRRAMLSCGRKNAKTYLVAGMLLAHLIGPEAQPNGQIYSCACDAEQAAVIFRMCQQMIEATPSLQRYLTVVGSRNTIFVKRMDCVAAGSRFKALSAESSTKHGLGADFFVYDEFGEAPLKDDLWNTMFDGQQLRARPLAVAISTQTNNPNHPFSIMLDDGLRETDPSLVAHLHAADEGCDLMDQEQWFKANPSLDTWRPIKPIEVAAKEAQRLPSKEANFRRRYLNQRVSPYSGLISIPDWKACAGDAQIKEGEGIYLGLDLSITTDLTALVAVSDGEQSKVQPWFWKPLDYVDEHSKRDGQPYDVWLKQGHLIAPTGRVVDLKSVAMKIAELSERYTILGLAYDRYGMANLMKEFDNIGLFASEGGKQGGLPIFPWGQGFASMSPAINAMEEEILRGTLVHAMHPLLSMCMSNAVAVMDPSGNRKLDKAKSTLRIDGAQALAMALGLKARERAEYVPPNPFEDPNFNSKSMIA